MAKNADSEKNFLWPKRSGKRRVKQGKRIGRPRVTDRRGFNRRFGAVLERIVDGRLSRRQAARELDIGYATLKRLLDTEGIEGSNDG